MTKENQASLEHNNSQLNRLPDKLINYCGPLLDQVGIKIFIYRSFEAEGNGSFYSTDIRFDNLALDNLLANTTSFYEEIKHLTPDRYSFVLWSDKTHGQEAYYQQFQNHDIWDGLNVYRRRSTHIEFFTFAGLNNVADTANFYLNNYDFITRFISFFLMKVESAPVHTARFRFAFKEKLAEIFSNDNSQNTSDLSTIIQDDRIVISTPNGDVWFSHRESSCLRLLASGKTAKEIARVLSLSHRTIESYINNVSQKTGLRTRSELVDAYHKTVPFVTQF